MGCVASQHTRGFSVHDASKNEVDEQLAMMQEEESNHYKVRPYNNERAHRPLEHRSVL